MTINNDSSGQRLTASSLALAALGWILADDARAHRLLDLTGLTPDGLRSGLDRPATQRAVLEFLCQHEPDLLAAAEALGVAPERLASASQEPWRELAP